MDSSFDKTVVPPDHHLNIYTPASLPVIQTTNAGAIIANLGTSSDMFQQEFCQIAEAVESSISAITSNGGANRLPILIPAEECLLSDLFAPNDIKVTPHPGLLLWVMDAGSALLWLRNPEPLLEAIHRAGLFRLNSGPITQFVLLNIELSATGVAGSDELRYLPPPGTLELSHLLSDAEATTAAIAYDKKFYIEVTRPDCILSVLRTAPLPNACAPDKEASSVARAPRLQRLTLAAIEKPNKETREQLFRELLTREEALLVLIDPEGGVSLMSWPEIGEALPVFPDRSSLLQAAEDTKKTQDSFGFAQFSPRDLFCWVDQQPIGGIMLNTYKDRDNPRYLFIPISKISDLVQQFNSKS